MFIWSIAGIHPLEKLTVENLNILNKKGYSYEQKEVIYKIKKQFGLSIKNHRFSRKNIF